eukprot:4562993-Lingulodinium_polyedra.AAC.1
MARDDHFPRAFGHHGPRWPRRGLVLPQAHRFRPRQARGSSGQGAVPCRGGADGGRAVGCGHPRPREALRSAFQEVAG